MFHIIDNNILKYKYPCFVVTVLEEVKKKVANLRTTYSRERTKTRKRKSGDGVADVYEPKWVHFKSLQFLDDFVVAKRTISNLTVSAHRTSSCINMVIIIIMFIAQYIMCLTIMYKVLSYHVPLPLNLTLFCVKIMAQCVSGVLSCCTITVAALLS